jgi:hypothetical protein
MAIFSELFPGSRRRISFTLKYIWRIPFRLSADVFNVKSRDIAASANTKNSYRRFQSRSYRSVNIVQSVSLLAKGCMSGVPSLAVSGFSLLRITPGHNQQHNKWIPGNLSTGIQRLQNEAHYSMLSTTEITNAYSYTELRHTSSWHDV